MTSTRTLKLMSAPSIALLCVGGMLGGLAAPAAATEIPVTPAVVAHAVPIPSQQYVAPVITAQPDVTRDSYTITAPPPPPPVVVPAVVAHSTTVIPTTAGTASKAVASTTAVPVSVVAPAPSYSGSAVIAYAQQFVGVVPYGDGNNPNDSFSCDGLVQYVMGAFGKSLPRGADHQAAIGTQIPQSQAVAGDLLWYPGQHIGIYDGNGGMIDSPGWGRFVLHRNYVWGNPIYIRLP